MKNTTLVIAFIIAFSFSSQSQIQGEYVKNHLIVKLTPEAAKGNVPITGEVLEKLKLDQLSNTSALGNKKVTRTHLFKFEEEQDIEQLMDSYMSTGLFEYVEPNFIGYGGGKKGEYRQTIPGDQYFSRQWGLHNDGTFSLSPATVDADIDMDLAWDIEQGDPSIIIATLDAGAKLDHPEFAGRIWTNSAETLNGADSDNNGFTDDVTGWDFAYNDNDPTDDYGHGTNVMGIIGSNGDNGIGYAGVDWNATLMVCKILDVNNSGQYSWWTGAIYYAVDHGANVINMSVGGGSFSQSMKDAVDYAYTNGVTIVACMMNYNNNTTYYPAGYANTIAVGSTNANDERSDPFFWSGTSGSNYGNHLDLVAPGNYIYGPHYNSDTNYGSYWGGTSQATPHVTGVCGLLMAQDPNRNTDDLRSILRNTAEDQVGHPSEDIAGWDQYYGAGRLNAYDALGGAFVNIEEEIIDRLEIYPNPVSGQTISINAENLDGNYQVSIINLLGEVVQQETMLFSGQVNELQLNAISEGVYLLQLTNGNSSFTEKLIIE